MSSGLVRFVLVKNRVRVRCVWFGFGSIPISLSTTRDRPGPGRGAIVSPTPPPFLPQKILCRKIIFLLIFLNTKSWGWEFQFGENLGENKILSTYNFLRRNLQLSVRNFYRLTPYFLKPRHCCCFPLQTLTAKIPCAKSLSWYTDQICFSNHVSSVLYFVVWVRSLLAIVSCAFLFQ